MIELQWGTGLEKGPGIAQLKIVFKIGPFPAYFSLFSSFQHSFITVDSK